MGEPNWRQFAEYKDWTDTDGCLVRIDVLAERPGPDHCGWHDAEVLIMGVPLGTRYTTPADTREYVRDPKGVFERSEFVARYERADAPPEDALDTGFRSGSAELWMVPTETTSVWLVDPAGGAERWPQGPTPVCS